MSDPDKPTPESPRDSDAEAPASGPDPAAPAANVISIEQARMELLGRKRRGATPPRGMEGPIRMRRREVPAPVTMPPGEHSSVIVTDTPAARAHIDKKTVHPGEPGQTFDRKVRVKTQFDPRRMPTQLSDRRAAERLAETEAPPEVAGEEEVGSLWNRPSTPSDPGVITARTSRTSLARPRPIPRNDRSAPLFVVGVMMVAAIGAAVVFMLSRGKGNEGSGQPDVTATAPVASVGAPPATSATSAPASGAQVTASATASGEAPSAGVSATASASGAPGAGVSSGPAASSAPAGPVVTRPSSSGTATKPAASAAPTTAPQATATSILPFGKEEP